MIVPGQYGEPVELEPGQLWELEQMARRQNGGDNCQSFTLISALEVPAHHPDRQSYETTYVVAAEVAVPQPPERPLARACYGLTDGGEWHIWPITNPNPAEIIAIRDLERGAPVRARWFRCDHKSDRYGEWRPATFQGNVSLTNVLVRYEGDNTNSCLDIINVRMGGEDA